MKIIPLFPLWDFVVCSRVVFLVLYCDCIHKGMNHLEVIKTHVMSSYCIILYLNYMYYYVLIFVSLHPQLIKVKFMFFIQINTRIFVLLCKTYNSVGILNVEHYKSLLVFL
jgi:hypothetical protein